MAPREAEHRLNRALHPHGAGKGARLLFRDDARAAQGLETGRRCSHEHLRGLVRVPQSQVLGEGLEVHQPPAHVLEVERVFGGVVGGDRFAPARHVFQQPAGVSGAGERSPDLRGDRIGRGRIAADDAGSGQRHEFRRGRSAGVMIAELVESRQGKFDLV